MEAEEEIEEIPRDCPPDGFHSEKQDDDREEDEALENDEDRKKIIPERVQLLRDIIGHTRHFISMVKCPRWQILSLDIVSRCVLLMEMDR